MTTEHPQGEDHHEEEALTAPPTLAQCLAFKEAVDRGRAAFDIEPASPIAWEDVTPSDPWGCLSHRLLFDPVAELHGQRAYVGQDVFRLENEAAQRRLAAVLDPEARDVRLIPDVIVAVTRPFDAISDEDHRDDLDEFTAAVREVLQDAEVVAR